jgi:Ni/Co efflux regulator RcnB
MRRAGSLAFALLAGLSFTVVIDSAQADRRERHRHQDRWDDWDNRRDARRAGIIAGTAAASIAGSAARENARDEYEECMRLYSYGDRYDRYCREEYYRDRYAARRTARRTGVIVGLSVQEIVRD